MTVPWSALLLWVFTAPFLSAQDCKLSDAHVLTSDTTRPLVALASFPGSGNTWVRILLEKSTRLRTGSEYYDRALVRAGLVAEGAEYMHRTTCFKTHYPLQWGSNSQQKAPTFKRFVWVIRHPLDAALSYASYSLSASRTAHNNAVDRQSMQRHMASSVRGGGTQFHRYQ
jgi:hypothetical protein